MALIPAKRRAACERRQLAQDYGNPSRGELSEVGFWREQLPRSPPPEYALSLGRLWQSQGKRDEARGLVGEIDSSFTEGFDTADLQEAEGLLYVFT